MKIRLLLIKLSLAIAVVLLPVMGFALGRSLLDDRPQLSDEADRVTSIVDETIRALGPGRDVALDPIQSWESPPVEDLLDERFGYDRCDSWWNIILPGWAAALVYSVAVHGEDDEREVVEAVRALWSVYGGKLSRSDNGGLALELEHAHFRLGKNAHTGAFDLSGGTRCLPTD